MTNQERVRILKNTVAVLWRKACEYDEIETSAKFVCFSADNRDADLYNRAVGELMSAKRDLADPHYLTL